MGEFSDDRPGMGRVHVEEQLHRLRDAVLVPPHPDYVEPVRRRLDAASVAEPRRAAALPEPYRRLRPVVVAAVAFAIAIAATVAIPDTRRAVANLFGFSGVRVHLEPSPTTARTTFDPTADFGEPVTLSEAEARVSFPIALPSAPELATPDAVYVRTGPGLESVTLVYRPRTGLAEILQDDIGLVVSEYAGEAVPYFDKYLDQAHPPTPVTVAGSWPGLRFAGPQEVLIRGPGGVVYSEYPRVSAPTVVWQVGEVTYRFEANVGRQRALDLAATIE